MSTVIARLTKYPLLLEKILKYTDGKTQDLYVMELSHVHWLVESDPDYAFVGSALEASRV